MSRYVLTAEQEALYRASPRLVTPSKEAPWEGRYDDGERFSQKQVAELQRLGLDPTAIDFLVFEVPGDPRRLGALTVPTPISFRTIHYFYRRVPCPILGARGDRLRIIAPDGSTKMVYPNGQLKRSRAA